MLRFLQRYYLLFIFLLFIPVTIQKIEPNPRSLIWSDTEGYYMYLPGLFIINDLHKIPEGSMNVRKNEKNEVVIKYTYGVSIFYFPFFVAAKYLSGTFGYDYSDYFNPVYCYAIAVSGYLFGFLGLFVLQRSLRRYFSEIVVALTVLSIFMGTNLFYYITRQMSMSHGYSFFLFSLILWLTPKWYRSPDTRNTVLLGLITGWIILIRPTNIFILLFFIGYDIYNRGQLSERIRFLVNQKAKLALAAVSGFIMFIPQMLYWHEMTGSFLRYSYEGEEFIYWNKPKIAEVLFDVQNGLFLYSPIVLFSIIGIFMGLRQKKAQAPSVGIIFIIITYIFASWWAWWFGGAFGHRCYIEFYAILALPMALFFTRILSARSVAVRYGVLLLTIFLNYYGVKMAALYSKLPGPWDGKDWIWNFDKIKWIWSYLFK